MRRIAGQSPRARRPRVGAARPGLEPLESRQLLAASVTLDANSGVLTIVGTAGNDLAEVDFGETTAIVDGQVTGVPDTTRIVARVQDDAGGPALEVAFKADSVKSVRYEGRGGTDYLANRTTRTSTWTTANGGLVNTSLMVGSPGYAVPGATGGVGVFQVGPSGRVGVDYLFRGAGYNGQLAIFSLAGMDAYKPGSTEYIREASRRALSESTLGHVAIRADKEGAKFSAALPWEANMNKGTYQGVHVVTMNPGDRFAAMIVPNGTVQRVYDSATWASDLRPLFSVPAANPYPTGTQYLGQVGDLDGHGSLFAFEDIRLDGSSDRDYNDMVFQVTGARGLSTPVSEVTNASRNLQATPIFQQQIATYAAAQAQADDVGAVAGLLAGGFNVGPTGRVGVDYVVDADPEAGEVGIFSLQGMAGLTPGSPEFLREAARRALTETVAGHVVISDAFDDPRGEAGYKGSRTFAMTPGDSFGVLTVASGTIWGLFTGATPADPKHVGLSLPGGDGDGDGATLEAVDTKGGPAWSVGVGGTRVEIAGATANVGPGSSETADFCAVAYLDRDDNGRADPADPSLAGVEVTIAGIDFAGRSVSRTVVSAADGCAEFDDLPAGIYRVSAVDPTGRTLGGGAQAGTAGGNVSDGAVSGIVLRPGDHARAYAVGRIAPARVRGAVYGDLDRDRIFDGSEPGLERVAIRLTGTDDRGARVDRAATTAADGSYAFEGLRPGVYALAETQPAGWVDGRESIGTFLGQPHPIARNGVARNDLISGLTIRPGEEGYNYNFAEWVATPDDVAYAAEVSLAGTERDDAIEIILGESAHLIRINDAWEKVDASAATILTLDGLGGEDAVTIVGLPGSESITIAPGLATLIAPNLRLEVNGAASVAFQGGTGDRAFLYDTPGDDIYVASPTERVLAGPGHRATVVGVERVYAYATAGGADVATLTDSQGADTFKATPGDARLYGATYYNSTRGFDRVEGKAGWGGADRAYLYDGPGDDTFVGDPTLGRLRGRDFDLLARGFGRVDAYATSGGVDRAALVGSAGDDRFFAGPIEAQMVGAGYDLHAIGFEASTGWGALGGADRAYLTGTQADDVLAASYARARLTGPGLDVTAEAFPWAYVSGGSCLGTDAATLSDSPNRDVFEAGPNAGRLYGPGYSIRVENFTRIGASSTAGGVDKAVFKDSAGDDVLDAAPGRARLSGVGFENAALGFAAIEVDGSAGGFDRATLTDSSGDDTLTASGSTLSLTTTGLTLRLAGFESVAATSTLGKNRKRLAAIDYALSLPGTWVV